jgi:hypothetical protein
MRIAGLISSLLAIPLAAVVGFAVAGSTLATTQTHNDGDILPPKPTGLAELARRSDLVVLGTVTALLAETVEGPFEARGRVPDESIRVEEPFSYYRVEVDEALRGSVPDTGLVLRVYGHSSERTRFGGQLTPQIGDERLLILSENPDGTFAPTDSWGIVELDRGRPRFTHESDSSVGDASSFRNLEDVRASLGEQR